MLLKLFKGTSPSVLFLIPVVGFILWIPTFFDLIPSLANGEVTTNTFLFSKLLWLLSFHPKASIATAWILLLVQSFILIRLNYKFIFIESKTYLPSLVFIMLASIFTMYQNLHPFMVANLFLLLALNYALPIIKDRDQIKPYFESSLFLGIGILFCPNAFVFIIVIWLSLVIFRAFNWREWLVTLIGLVLPVMFYLIIVFLTGNLNQVTANIEHLLITPSQTHIPSIYVMAAMGFLGFVSLIAVFYSLALVGVKKINTRKYVTFFIWFALTLIVLFFTVPSLGYNLIVPFAIPLAIILSLFFVELRKKWLGEVLFGLMLLSIFVIVWLN